MTQCLDVAPGRGQWTDSSPASAPRHPARAKNLLSGGARRHSLVTADPSEAQDALCNLYYPLRLGVLGPDKHFSFDLEVIELGPLSLGLIRYESEVRIDCGELGTAYHVNIPLSGRIDSSCGQNDVIATPDLAAVFTPNGRTVLHRWSAGATQLCLKIDRTALESDLQARLGKPLRTPIRFEFGLDVTAGGGRSWRHAVQMLAGEFDNPGGLAAQPLLASEIQQIIMTGLLISQPHDYRDELLTPVQPARPRTIRRAIDLIESSPERPWTMPELAREAGTSVRTMQSGFQRYVGMSPRAYLQRCRLERAREDFESGHANQTTVAEVAHRWGFSHLGRFAQAYQRAFGVGPSRTLHGLKS